MRPPLIYLEGEYSSSCGYCKHSLKPENEETAGNESIDRKTFGMEAYSVPATLYDTLIQYNWRRCGSLYYRPNNSTMCCPQYAIRVPASEFVVKQAGHRRVLRRLRQYLYQESSDDQMETDEIEADDQKRKTLMKELNDIISSCFRELIDAEFPCLDLQVPVKLQERQFKGQKLHIACNVIVLLASLLRKSNTSVDIASLSEKLKVAIQKSGRVPSSVERIEASSSGYLNFYTSLKYLKESKKKQSSEKLKQKWKLVLVVEPSKFKEDEFEMYSEYQQTVHQDPASKITKRGYSDFLCNSSINPTVDEDFAAEIEVEISETGNDVTFSPLDAEIPHQSLHVRYELHSIEDPDDKQLLAFSVIDSLPTGLSSVYFIYDPEYSHLSLGVASALIEILLIKHRTDPEFQYYYLGYYIHGCSKMRYKGQYEPSEILCPLTLRWTSLDDRTRKLLDITMYTRISPEDGVSPDKMEQQVDVNNFRFLINQKYVLSAETLFQKAKLSKTFTDKFAQFQSLAPAQDLLDTSAIIILLESDLSPI